MGAGLKIRLAPTQPKDAIVFTKGDYHSQMFVLVFLLGGAFSMGFFLMGLGVYHWGKNQDKKNK